MIAMHKQNYKTQLPCWNTLETSLKHLRNTSPKTPWQHIKTPFKLPGRTIDTLLTHLKQHWNLLGILLKHHCNYLKTFLKYPWNIHEEPMNYFSNNLEAHINHSWHFHEAIFETSLELPWNSIETSLKHLKHPLNYTLKYCQAQLQLQLQHQLSWVLHYYCFTLHPPSEQVVTLTLTDLD